jgi:hypothetical protein
MVISCGFMVNVHLIAASQYTAAACGGA